MTDNFGLFPAISDASFLELYGKVAWTVTDWFTLGGYVQYTSSYLNTGAEGTYFAGTAKFTAPSSLLPAGIGAYLSGEVGRQELGTADAYTTDVPTIGPVAVGAVDLPSYTTWNVGVGFTWNVFTLDLRYSDTNLSKTDCALITGDPATSLAGESNWCGSTFIAKLSADLTLGSLK
jgi:hypothetical protein